MKRGSCRFLSLLAVLWAALAFAADDWRSKPFTQWSEGEARKIITNSPWTRLGDVVIPQRLQASSGGGNVLSGADRSGTLGGASSNQTVPYQLTWYTRVPRQASARLLQLERSFSDAEAQQMVEQDLPAGQWKFVFRSRLASIASPDALAEAQEFTQLIRNDGVKLGLAQMEDPPGRGYINYLFPMNLPDGSPFIRDDTKEITFQTRVRGSQVKTKFKVADCRIDGALEP